MLSADDRYGTSCCQTMQVLSLILLAVFTLSWSKRTANNNLLIGVVGSSKAKDPSLAEIKFSTDVKRLKAIDCLVIDISLVQAKFSCSLLGSLQLYADYLSPKFSIYVKGEGKNELTEVLPTIFPTQVTFRDSNSAHRMIKQGDGHNITYALLEKKNLTSVLSVLSSTPPENFSSNLFQTISNVLHDYYCNPSDNYPIMSVPSNAQKIFEIQFSRRTVSALYPRLLRLSTNTFSQFHSQLQRKDLDSASSKDINDLFRQCLQRYDEESQKLLRGKMCSSILSHRCNNLSHRNQHLWKQGQGNNDDSQVKITAPPIDALE